MTDADSPRLSIVMPAYNEEESLPWALDILIGHLDRRGYTFEVIVVDDGSRDRTAQVATEYGQRRREIRLVRHERNLGPGSGIPTGLRLARGTFVAFIPADLGLEPEDLMRCVAEAERCDVVSAVRSERGNMPWRREFVSAVNICLTRTLFNLRLRQFTCLFVYRRSIFDRLWPESRGVFLTTEILVKARDRGFRIREVECRYLPRVFGEDHCGQQGVIVTAVRELFRFWTRWALWW